MSGEEVAARLEAVRERIARAAEGAGRDPGDITLVGVSKGQPAERLLTAVRAGLGAVGESYVQEALPKLAELEAALAAEGLARPRRHFVGRLQRNKVRRALPAFDVFESLDRPRLGDELERCAAATGRTLEVLIQVSLCGETQKGGVEERELPALLEASSRWPHLRVVGLMTVPTLGTDPETSRPVFAKLRDLAESLRSAGAGSLRELSMGMSADFEVAIQEGATWVRVGTAVFGPRRGGG